MKKVTQDQLILVFAIMLFIGILLYVYNQGKRKGLPIADIGDDYVRPAFNPSAWVSEGHYLLTDWTVWATGAEKRTKYLERLNTLSDGELKTVYNAYNEKYLNTGKTFVQVIREAWVTTVFEQNPKNIILDRFQRMQLN